VHFCVDSVEAHMSILVGTIAILLEELIFEVRSFALSLDVGRFDKYDRAQEPCCLTFSYLAESLLSFNLIRTRLIFGRWYTMALWSAVCP
jgi:hypothetical protein